MEEISKEILLNKYRAQGRTFTLTGKITVVIITFLSILFNSGFSQSLDLNQYKSEMVNVLNTCINSAPFDSIYQCQPVYFERNELISFELSGKIKKGKRKVRFDEKTKLINKGKSYINIGDLYILKEESLIARVQLYSTSSKRTLNLVLKHNENGMWQIVNHLLMDE